MDKNLNTFLDELSSFSPITDEFEANIATISIYISLLQKNNNFLINKLDSQKASILKDFQNILTSSKECISKNYSISNDYVNSCLISFKLKRGTSKEINEYNNYIDNILSKKINSCLDIITSISQLITKYEECEELYNSNQKDVIKLCIKIILSIKQYLIDSCKKNCLEISDSNLAINIMDTIKTKE